MRFVLFITLAGCFLNGMPIGPQYVDTGYVEVDTGDTYDVIVDSGTTARYCEDADSDGFGNVAECVVRTEAPERYVSADNGNDCDDVNPDAYPGAVEVDEDVDENCDGITDEGEGDDPTRWCEDVDGDGYGAGPCTAEYAGYPTYVSNDDDCDDARADVNLDADEWEHDLVDNDCDGYIDEDYRDAVICVTPANVELYEIFLAGSTFEDFTFAPGGVWEPGESWFGLVTEVNGADEASDEAREFILDRGRACGLLRVDWRDEFMINGLVLTVNGDVRLLADSDLDQPRMASIMIDGHSDACLLEDKQFRCIRP